MGTGILLFRKVRRAVSCLSVLWGGLSLLDNPEYDPHVIVEGSYDQNLCPVSNQTQAQTGYSACVAYKCTSPKSA